jgi:putative DNA primase/helicase
MLNSEDVARGKWFDILKDAGLHEDLLDGKQHPCPMCGGKDRWRFDNKEDRGTWFCNSCGAGDGYKLYMYLTGEKNFNAATKKIARDYGALEAKKQEVRKNNREALNKLWKGSTDGKDEINAYLAIRGITSVPEGVIGRTLRFHPHTPWTNGGIVGYAPAMLARVFNSDGTAATIHRTFLTTDVPVRKMLMPHDGKLSGCYIPLGQPVGNRLGVAEGIETALAAHMDSGMVVWATYCAEQRMRFVENESIDSLSIFGDNDASFVGQAAAYRLAAQAVKRGKEVDVQIPFITGDDWNDVLLKRGANYVSSDPA